MDLRTNDWAAPAQLGSLRTRAFADRAMLPHLRGRGGRDELILAAGHHVDHAGRHAGAPGQFDHGEG